MTDLKKPLKEELFPIRWDSELAKKTRIDLGLTQGDVASYLGVCVCTVKKFESGNSASTTMALAYGTLLERYSRYYLRKHKTEETS